MFLIWFSFLSFARKIYIFFKILKAEAFLICKTRQDYDPFDIMVKQENLNKTVQI